MKVILTVDIRGGEQGAAQRLMAETAAKVLLRAAHGIHGYFGATVEIKEED